MSATLVEPFEVVVENTSEITVPEWLAHRMTGEGSTDAASANDVSHWKSKRTLWAEKSGLLAEPPDKDRFVMGRTFEGPIFELWADRFGYDLNAIQRHVMVRSLEHPFMLANPDGLASDFVGEVKTAHPNDAARWEIRVPLPYRYQATHLMAVTGRRRCVLIVCFGWTLPVEFWIEWEQDLADEMIANEADLWRRVQENDPPDLDSSESTLQTMREIYYASEKLKWIELPPEALSIIEKRENAVSYGKILDEYDNYAKSQLIEMLGDAEIGVVGGTVVVTRKQNKNGDRRFYFPDRAA